MSYLDRVRTCPHGIKHDPFIDSASVCPECKREEIERNNKIRCPVCMLPTMVKSLGMMRYCSNPKCPDYNIHKMNVG